MNKRLMLYDPLCFLCVSQTLPLISQSRRMVREGPVTELMDFSLKDTERNVYLHLFNDYLLLSLQKEWVNTHTHCDVTLNDPSSTGISLITIFCILLSLYLPSVIVPSILTQHFLSLSHYSFVSSLFASSRGGRFTVIDHSPVSDLRVENCRVKLHSLQKNLFRLHMSQKSLLLRTETL